jgi:hypothetical protein
MTVIKQKRRSKGLQPFIGTNPFMRREPSWPNYFTEDPLDTTAIGIKVQNMSFGGPSGLAPVFSLSLILNKQPGFVTSCLENSGFTKGRSSWTWRCTLNSQHSGEWGRIIEFETSLGYIVSSRSVWAMTEQEYKNSKSSLVSFVEPMPIKEEKDV